MLSKHILTAKIMIIKNLKIQMLAGNSLKMCVGVGFEISSTLEIVYRILQLFRHWQGIESAAISIIGVSDIKEVCAVIIFMTKPVTFKNHILTSKHHLIGRM